MNLCYITCSDPREDTPLADALMFLIQNPMAELAVQTHPTKMSPGMPRRVWFDALMQLAATISEPVNLAMHVNLEWCNQLCLGQIPDAIKPIFDARHPVSNSPLVRRIQINLSGSQSPQFDARAVADLINAHPQHEFILQYTPAIHPWIHQLQGNTQNFSVLYDASNGTGIAPQTTEKPFPGVHATGYSGGISPENVTARLTQINLVARNVPTWIDAEGRLKKPGSKSMDLIRAQIYVNRAMRYIFCPNQAR